jgi:hypothetical protein
MSFVLGHAMQIEPRLRAKFAALKLVQRPAVNIAGAACRKR